MENLDQIRAAAALSAAPQTSRQAASKLPAMILTNGLLAATAFACEKDKEARKEMKAAMDSIAAHLATDFIGIDVLKDNTTGLKMLTALSTASSQDLQRATAEALAFLAFLKRFAPKKDTPEE